MPLQWTWSHGLGTEQNLVYNIDVWYNLGSSQSGLIFIFSDGSISLQLQSYQFHSTLISVIHTDSHTAHAYSNTLITHWRRVQTTTWHSPWPAWTAGQSMRRVSWHPITHERASNFPNAVLVLVKYIYNCTEAQQTPTRDKQTLIN